jgi:hypothetical protein
VSVTLCWVSLFRLDASLAGFPIMNVPGGIQANSIPTPLVNGADESFFSCGFMSQPFRRPGSDEEREALTENGCLETTYLETFSTEKFNGKDFKWTATQELLEKRVKVFRSHFRPR